MASPEVPPASTASSNGIRTIPIDRGIPRETKAVSARRQLGSAGFLLPALLVYALFVLLPLAQVGWAALQRWDGFGPQVFIGLSNFSDLWNDPGFRAALRHSLWWEGAAVGLTAAGLGIALAARSARWGTGATALILFPVLLPQTVVAAIWTLVYSPLSGLLDTALGRAGLASLTRAWLGDPGLALPALIVAWAWASLGVGTVILGAGLQAIAQEYMELALVEGAGPLWRFRRVILPGVRRSLIIAFLVSSALAFQVFDLIFVTTGGGPGDSTMTLPIDMYGRAFGGRTGQGAAVATAQALLGVALAAVALVLLRVDRDGMDAGTRERQAHRRWEYSVSLLPAILFCVLPLAWLVGVALRLSGVTFGPVATLDPRTWNIGSFGAVWNAGMGGAMGTSFWLATVCAAGTLVLAVPAAFAIDRLLGRRARIFVLVLLALGLFEPTPVLIIPLFSLLQQLGMLDSPWGILLPEIARVLPLAIGLIWVSIAGLPGEVLEASAVDGASPTRQMLRIALPLALPGVAAAGAWAFITSWNEYLLPTVVSQDGSLQTVPTLLATFVGRYDTEYSQLAAGALLALAPSLLLYVAFRGRMNLRPASGTER